MPELPAAANPGHKARHDIAAHRPFRANRPITRGKPRAADVPLNLLDLVIYRLSFLAGRNTRCLAAMYGERFGLTVAAWRVLSIIGACAPISANAVGRHSSLEPDKVSRAVDRLVRSGLVVRRQDTRDKRYFMLSLSPRGKTVSDEMDRLRNAIELEFLSVLSRRELASLYTILDKLKLQSERMFTGKESWRDIVARQGIVLAAGARRKLATKSANGRRPAEA